MVYDRWEFLFVGSVFSKCPGDDGENWVGLPGVVVVCNMFLLNGFHFFLVQFWGHGLLLPVVQEPLIEEF